MVKIVLVPDKRTIFGKQMSTNFLQMTNYDKNHGVFCFEECSSFEKADFFLCSADGDFLSSDSFPEGTFSMLAG